MAYFKFIVPAHGIIEGQIEAENLNDATIGALEEISTWDIPGIHLSVDSSKIIVNRLNEGEYVIPS